ncbi:UvrD-helicase domain-containing protein [Flavobacterium sp.]|uniref:UvrD-helicase domain-containing protein n=1 Tax=Flavobacterium sp. TaxID=239 RepID=UPI00122B6658|nr:UvrD-helicase domain-containing protein [Flavobacterium sp.]RZJ69484.1 MAG: hypothetical protein EOO49_17395 [Flavobacterium sp.]
MELLITTISIALTALLFLLKKRTHKKKYQSEIYLKNLAGITEFNSKIDSLNDYCTWPYREEIKTDFIEIGTYFRNKTNYYKKEEKVKIFNEIFDNFDNYIANYNTNYILRKKENLKWFFEDIEGKKLDDQQQNAVITDEYSNLIIAGAGSGKTLTILAKIKYLTAIKNVKPSEILLLSFTKKTVDELNERLGKIALATKATTFHKLGYDTIKSASIDVPAITNDNTLKQIVTEYLRSDILENPEAINSYIRYIACYMNIPEEHEKYTSLGEKSDVEKGIDFETLKAKTEPLNKIATADLDTLQGEKVKSVEELIIANFLYLNGIEYEYEKKYPHTNVMYRPDFHLSEYDIWLEHFGVDENNNAKWLTPHNAENYVRKWR